MKLYFLLIGLIIALLNGIAGKYSFDKSEYEYSISRTNEKINIDGLLEEEIWQHASPIGNFWQHYPVDSIKALSPTDVRIAYDDKYLYIAVLCHANNASPVIQTLKRDDGDKFWYSDGFSVIIDPVNNGTNGYFFGLNAAGAIVDGTVSHSGAEPQLDLNWNNIWHSSVKSSSQGYTYEIAIPFSSLKYSPGNNKWGINFIRNDMNNKVYDMLTRYSLNHSHLSFAYNAQIELSGDLPEKNGQRFEFTPSVSGKMIQDFETSSSPDYSPEGGLDAKIALGSRQNLDLTLFPDFSTVEVDQQYIEYNNFEWYMPEQRQFFLENNDLFNSYGTSYNTGIPPYNYKIKPLYTRRIGIKDWNYLPMIYGARFSGNVSNDLRLGLLNIQIDKTNEDKASNYSVATFQQSMLKRSSLRGLVVNRQATNDVEFEKEDFNRTAGMEFDYISDDSKWVVSSKYHTSINPVKYKNNDYYGGGFVYTANKFHTQHWFNHVGENYINDAGYVPRLYRTDFLNDTTRRVGYNEFISQADYAISPVNGKVSRHFFNTFFAAYFLPDGSFNEFQEEHGYWVEFNNKSNIWIGVAYNYIDLLYHFDVLNNDKPIVPGEYHNTTAVFDWKSNPVKKVTYRVYGDYGTFYSGIKYDTELRIGLRAQPWGNFLMSYMASHFEFSEEYGNGTYHLLGARSEVYFSKDLTWTSLMQYNTQKNNININSMLQWRFRPLSDFYVVFKDDFSASNTEQKKIQVSFKLTWWFKI